MNPRTTIVLLCAALIALPSFVSGQVSLDSEDEKTLYAIGLAMAQNLGSLQLTGEELRIVQQGITDALAGSDPKVNLQEYGPKIQSFAQARQAQAATAAKEAGAAFLAAEAAKPGAQRTDSGLIITEITPGTGASPTATDEVTVHYHGTLTDGTVFDSSVERNAPATFALNQVVPCWTEGVAMIKVGGKSRLVCPSDLAYGDGGRPGIPPGATLIFEVELLSISGP